jgi:hypothetical protein
VDALIIGGFLVFMSIAMAARSALTRGLGDRNQDEEEEAGSSSNVTRLVDGIRQGEYERSDGYWSISKGFLGAALVALIVAGILAIG